MPSEQGLSGQRAEVIIATIQGSDIGVAYGSEAAIYADFIGVALSEISLPDTTLEKAFIHAIQYYISGDSAVSVTIYLFEGKDSTEFIDGAGLRPRG